MHKREYVKTKNDFNSKRELPRGIAVYQKKRKDGTFITTKKSRYNISRGERRSIIFENLEIEAKNTDNYLKECVIHQMYIGNEI